MTNETKKLIDNEITVDNVVVRDLKIETELKEKELLLVEKDNIIKRQKKAICVLSEKMPLDEDEDDEIGSGIIYYITDKDMPSRGKIGRTKNTDIKKLNVATQLSLNLVCSASTQQTSKRMKMT